MINGLNFICGGAWSGKTAYAEKVAAKSSRVVWFGTGCGTQVTDFDEHIRELQAGRPKHWLHVEAPFDLAVQLKTETQRSESSTLVIDSLSQWICNLIASKAQRYDESQLAKTVQLEVDELIDIIADRCRNQYSVIVVSSDFSQSLPPAETLQRILRKSVGIANSKISSNACHLTFLMAGTVILEQHRQTSNSR